MNTKKIKYYSWVTVGSVFNDRIGGKFKPQIEKMNIINLKRSKLYYRYLEQLDKISKIIFLYLRI